MGPNTCCGAFGRKVWFLEQYGFKDVDVAVWAKGEADPLHYAVDLSVEAGAGLEVPVLETGRGYDPAGGLHRSGSAR